MSLTFFKESVILQCISFSPSSSRHTHYFNSISLLKDNYFA